MIRYWNDLLVKKRWTVYKIWGMFWTYITMCYAWSSLETLKVVRLTKWSYMGTFKAVRLTTWSSMETLKAVTLTTWSSMETLKAVSLCHHQWRHWWLSTLSVSIDDQDNQWDNLSLSDLVFFCNVNLDYAMSTGYFAPQALPFSVTWIVCCEAVPSVEQTVHQWPLLLTWIK